MDVYTIVTDRIIAQMEQGIIPWHKGWRMTDKKYKLLTFVTEIDKDKVAFNRISRKPYSFLNQLCLLHTGEYATFKQWADLGGKVRKGEKAEVVFFWKMLEVDELNEDGEKVKKTIPVLKYFNVFHISQVDGVAPLDFKLTETKVVHVPDDSPDEAPDLTGYEGCEAIISNYIGREHITLERSLESDSAYYRPSTDYIQVPRFQQFALAEEFYSTLFHEMTHSTGHEKRLGRLNKQANLRFGSNAYSQEELVAELGSAFLCSSCGIECKSTFDNSVAYLQSWLKKLKDDKRLIVFAAGQAEKAVKFILGDSVDGE